MACQRQDESVVTHNSRRVRAGGGHAWPTLEKADSQMIHDQGEAISIANLSQEQTCMDIARMGKMSQEAPFHPTDFARSLADRTDDVDHKIC